MHQEMNQGNKRRECLAWGALIGATLGLLEAVAGVRWWMAFGQPDFLVRPHHVGLYAIGNMVAGSACGLVFGALVREISKRERSTLNFRKLYAGLLITGVLVFVPLYYLILRSQVPLWLVGDVALFAWGIVLAKRIMKPNSAPPHVGDGSNRAR